MWACGLRCERVGEADARLRFRENRCQEPQLRFHVSGIGNRLGDLLPEQLAIAFAQPVDADFRRTLRRAHLASQVDVRHLRPSKQDDLEPVEVFRPATRDELIPELPDDPIDHLERPAPLEETLGRLVVRRLTLVAFFAAMGFERDEVSAAPL